MSKTYRWGILAPGKIANKFAVGLQSVPRAELYAIASRDLQKASDFAAQYHAPVSYGSYQELAQDPQVDIIYIANPHAFHMDSALMCLEQGKAVLCEKPLAINSQQVKRMVQSSKTHQAFMMEALWSRFLPHIQKAKELTDQGIIGNVQSVQVDFGFQAKYDAQSRLFNPALGGGALLDIGIYPLFFACLLFGQPQEVVAKVQLAPTGVDQTTQVHLKFLKDRTATIDFTFEKFTPIEAHIMGDQGEIKLQTRWYQPGNLFVKDHRGTKEVEVELLGNGYNYQAEEVMRCLDEGLIESPLWSHNHSWELAQLMDEIRRQGGVIYPMD